MHSELEKPIVCSDEFLDEIDLGSLESRQEKGIVILHGFPCKKV